MTNERDGAESTRQRNRENENVEGTTFEAEHNGELETHTVVRVLSDELLTEREGSKYRHAWPREILEDEDVEVLG